MSTNLSTRPSDEVLTQNWQNLCRLWVGSLAGKILGMTMFAGQAEYAKKNGGLKTKAKFEVMPRHVVGFISRANAAEALLSVLDAHRTAYKAMATKRGWGEASVNKRLAIYASIEENLVIGEMSAFKSLVSLIKTISAYKPILGLGNKRSINLVETMTEVVANRPTAKEYAKRVGELGLNVGVDMIAPEEFDIPAETAETAEVVEVVADSTESVAEVTIPAAQEALTA